MFSKIINNSNHTLYQLFPQQSTHSSITTSDILPTTDNYQHTKDNYLIADWGRLSNIN